MLHSGYYDTMDTCLAVLTHSPLISTGDLSYRPFKAAFSLPRKARSLLWPYILENITPFIATIGTINPRIGQGALRTLLWYQMPQHFWLSVSMWVVSGRKSPTHPQAMYSKTALILESVRRHAKLLLYWLDQLIAYLLYWLDRFDLHTWLLSWLNSHVVCQFDLHKACALGPCI